MLRFHVFDVTIEVSLLFTAFFGLVCAVSPFAFTALIFMLLHECGHLAAMLCVRLKPKIISFAAGRMTIVPDSDAADRGDTAAVLLAGAAVNLVCAAAAALAGEARMTNTNLFMAAFNLLPVRGTDGGGIVALLTENETLKRAVSFGTGGLLCAVGLCGVRALGVAKNPVLAAVGAFIALVSRGGPNRSPRAGAARIGEGSPRAALWDNPGAVTARRF